MNLSTAWYKGKTDKEKEDIESLLRNNTILVQTFLSLLDQMEEEELRGEITQKEYDNPSWAYKQADRNGARRAINKVKKLFNFLET